MSHNGHLKLVKLYSSYKQGGAIARLLGAIRGSCRLERSRIGRVDGRAADECLPTDNYSRRARLDRARIEAWYLSAGSQAVPARRSCTASLRCTSGCLSYNGEHPREDRGHRLLVRPSRTRGRVHRAYSRRQGRGFSLAVGWCSAFTYGRSTPSVARPRKSGVSEKVHRKGAAGFVHGSHAHLPRASPANAQRRSSRRLLDQQRRRNSRHCRGGSTYLRPHRPGQGGVVDQWSRVRHSRRSCGVYSDSYSRRGQGSVPEAGLRAKDRPRIAEKPLQGTGFWSSAGKNGKVMV